MLGAETGTAQDSLCDGGNGDSRLRPAAFGAEGADGGLRGRGGPVETRHKAGIEAYGGDFETTGDYRGLLDRKDVDAVLVATSDHHHRRVTLDAWRRARTFTARSRCRTRGRWVCDAGSGAGEQANLSGRQPAGELDSVREGAGDFWSGRLGDVHSIDAKWNRNSPGGAWVYPIPRTRARRRWTGGTSAGCAGSCVRPDAVFPVALFRDYGSGLGGDLFVHLLSGIQVITRMNGRRTAPTRLAGYTTTRMDGNSRFAGDGV